MIIAEHNKWAEQLFRFYIDRQFKKFFSHFYLVNLPPGSLNEISNVVFCPNHFSYWDGFMINAIYRKYFPNKKFYIMMLEEQLKRYWFFRKLGAFSIEPENPKKIIETIVYTEGLLKQGNSFIVIYPQGEYQDQDARLFSLKPGLIRFVRNAGSETKIIPVGFSIKMKEEKLPSVYCRFGDICNSEEVKNDFSFFSDRFNSNYRCLQEDILQGSFAGDLLK